MNANTNTGNIRLSQQGSFFCNVHENAMWCECLTKFFNLGHDRAYLQADQHLIIPIWPTAVFAEIYIGEEFVKTGACIMSLNFTPDIGRPYSIRLGFWNPGESCMIIRSVVLDYLKSQLHPDENLRAEGAIVSSCKSTATHTPAVSRLVQNYSKADRRWKQKCLWDMVMERACTICVQETSDPNNSGLAGL